MCRHYGSNREWIKEGIKESEPKTVEWDENTWVVCMINTRNIPYWESLGTIKETQPEGGNRSVIKYSQEQALYTNYGSYTTDKTANSPLCRKCNEKGECTSHSVSEYKQVENTVTENGKIICTSHRYMTESEECKMRWDLNNQDKTKEKETRSFW